MRNNSLIGLKFSVALEFHVAKVLLKFHYEEFFKKIEKNRKMAILFRNNFSIEPKS